MGPSGCGKIKNEAFLDVCLGKSSLLRILSGLWTGGNGKISLPEKTDVFFLPQKPYMPLGNLRLQLLFPQSNLEVSDSKLRGYLEDVHLDHILSRFGSFNVEIDWAQVNRENSFRIAFFRF